MDLLGYWTIGSGISRKMANSTQRFGTVGVLILATSAAMRWALCLSGGQYFLGDEHRYDRAVKLYLAFAGGKWADVRWVASQPEHALFPWIGAVITVLQHGLAQFTRFGDWSKWENIDFTMPLAACVLSLFSVLNIYLVFQASLRAGGTRREALWAAGLMAASNTNLYYCRHLLQYDAALALALGALVAALGAAGRRRLMAAGVLAAAAYETYNGYWFLVPLPILAAAWAASPGAWVRQAIWVAAGVASGISAVVLVGIFAGGAEYLKLMAGFSQSVTQGLYSEGWSLPWAYLWKSEGALGAAVVLGVAGLIVADYVRRRAMDTRIRLWLLMLGGAYGALVLFSVGLKIFVVYGRTTKALVPFLCLLGGWAINRIVGPRRLAATAVGLLLCASLLGAFSLHLTRVYPLDVEINVLRRYGNPKRSLTVSGSLYRVLVQPVTRPDLALINAQLLFPIRGVIGAPAGRTLLRVEHALTYEPYQYEGFSPKERNALRTTDISIRLIALASPSSVPDDLPLPLRYVNSDRPTGR